MPKKILIVCSHFWPSMGGVESRMGQFSTSLVNSGYAVTVLTQHIPHRSSNDFHGVLINGVDVNQFPAAIRDAVASGEFDTCILVQDPLGVIIWSIEDMTPPSNTRVLIQPIINEDGYSRWKDRPEFRSRLKTILKAADATLVMTKSGPDTRFMRSEGIDYTYLPNATTQVEPAGDFRAQYGIPREKFLVLHVANLYWVKNHIGLIDALPDIPVDWQLVMVGNVSGENDCGNAVMAKLAGRPEIRFIPGLSREWVAAAMQGADVVVLASKGEGSPITILEAMSHGKPWLATPECGAANDHVGGVICELKDFKAHLQVLADDPALCHSLGEISYGHWKQCYSWPVAIAGWIDLIEHGRSSHSFEPDQALRDRMDDARRKIAAALVKDASSTGRRSIESQTIAPVVGAGEKQLERNTKPLFSIIVTTHCRPALLARALLSLLTQTFTDFEIVLVSDEGSFETKTVANSYLRQEDIFLVLPNAKGPSETRNAGIYHAKGQFVMFLDDDDTYHPEYLQVLVANEGFKIDAVNYVNYTLLTETREGGSAETVSAEDIEVGGKDIRSLLIDNFIPGNAFVFATAMAKSVLFDPQLNSHESWDYMIALLFKYEFNFIDTYGPIVHESLRESRNNDAKKSGATALDYLSIYRKWRHADQEVMAARQAMLQSQGLDIPSGLL
ncbi:glycosyltransferase [Herbaspirillum sp. meg3]|uniref:glycosyltransferase n=1 Tax=Herbaspirillum sp. meg3 TaxID=2025949 RepID=UPI0018E02DF0|nr:glycosyltransferase [Herbaspirillum sp. meg3]